MSSARFIDIFVSREHRFSLGRDSRSGLYYLSTPVSGAMLAAEYGAYFSIDAADYALQRDTGCSRAICGRLPHGTVPRSPDRAGLMGSRVGA